MGSTSSRAAGRDPFVESFEHGFAFVGREIFDDVGNVGGMQLGQAIVRNLELDAAGGIGLDEVDEDPRNGAGRNAVEQGVQSGTGSESAQQAANRAAGADVDRMNAKHGSTPGLFLNFDL